MCQTISWLGQSNFLKSPETPQLVFIRLFLYGLNKQDETCSLVNSGGAVKRILLPVNRARLCFPPVSGLYAKLTGC